MVSIGRKSGTGPRLSPLLSPNKEGRVGSLRLLMSLIQALHTPILSPSIAKPIWNYYSLQQLHIFIYSACNILLNFLIHSQLTAETGSSVAITRACYKKACYKRACCEGTCRKGACRKKGGIGGRVGIGSRAGIGASSSKDTFRPSGVPLLLHKASSVVYSGEMGK